MRQPYVRILDQVKVTSAHDPGSALRLTVRSFACDAHSQRRIISGSPNTAAAG